MSAPSPNPLLQDAKAALLARDWRGALEYLERVGVDAMTVEGLMDKALAQRMLHDLQGAMVSLDTVLAREPAHLAALLSKGSLLERMGARAQAIGIYKRAIPLVGRDPDSAEALATPLQKARQAINAYTLELTANLRESVARVRARFPGEALERFDESLDILAGAARPFVQQPRGLHYPRLPAVPFYERSLFPWLGELETAAPQIQSEVLAILTTEPVYLWKSGRRQDGTCAACPRTAALIAALPTADQPGFAPTAVAWTLESHTRMPRGHGPTNTRLTVHLALSVKGPARLRVGNQTRDWQAGQAWVFDDTIEHEAWNDADTPCSILSFDIWNPYLSEAERDLVSAMMTAQRQFVGRG